MLLGFMAAVGPMEVLVLHLLILWPVCRICSRAGFHWALGLMALVPGLLFVLLLVLAFAEWPALRRGKSETDGLD
ncbi:hypothetical protein [Paludisphaera rhizosphaerae]|uniref:hypothetical protein n=1 Tax=Paludisphaera rhizosphaerae TaxID=2711216 RepID=UPI0013EA2AB5|nr:hypothetical protein [Paludisphaera rhizosphaerae]